MGLVYKNFHNTLFSGFLGFVFGFCFCCWVFVGFGSAFVFILVFVLVFDFFNSGKGTGATMMSSLCQWQSIIKPASC